MGLGFGFLRQMNDTIRYNRELLGKKKTLAEINKDHTRNKPQQADSKSLAYLRENVRKAIERNPLQERIIGMIGGMLLAILIVACIWFISQADFMVTKKGKHADPHTLYSTYLFKHSNGLDLKKEYFYQGTIAAETLLKHGRKHQQSESYYESGEQFRSALYFYDTLITEVYFFKNGDTIKNFPAIDDDKIHRIKVLHQQKKQLVDFEIWDGKLLPASYHENPVNQ